MNQTQRRKALIQMLLSEHPERYRGLAVPTEKVMQHRLLRALLNLREPMPAAPELLRAQDEYLQSELSRRGVTDAEAVEELQPGMLPLARRHHNASVRRDCQRGQQCVAGMLLSQPRLHRQRDSYLCRDAAAASVQRNHGCAGA